MPTRFQHYITGRDSCLLIYTSNWGAQTFTIAVTHRITSVRLLLARYPSDNPQPGNAVVSIRATGANGKPTGDDLCSGTTNANTLPIYEVFGWREISLGNGCTLNAGTKYAICVRCPDGDTSNRLAWGTDTSSATYEGGSCFASVTSGSSWTEYATYDNLFEDWGEFPSKFIILKDITTVNDGDVKVGPYSSFQTGYGFANAYTYWHQPWKEWRGCFSDQNDHDATLSFSGTINCLVILGANFSSIEINSVSKGLGFNPTYDDHRGLLLIAPATDSLAFTIPAQTTNQGYFKIPSVLMGNVMALTKNPHYPKSKQVVQPIREIMLESKHPRFGKQGRRNRILEFGRKGLHYADAEDLRVIKHAVGLSDPFVLYENLDDLSQTYLVRRLDDFQYQESGHNNYEDILRLEEIA